MYANNEVLHWHPTHSTQPEENCEVWFVGERGQTIPGVFKHGSFWDCSAGINPKLTDYLPSMWRYRDAKANL